MAIVSQEFVILQTIFSPEQAFQQLAMLTQGEQTPSVVAAEQATLLSYSAGLMGISAMDLLPAIGGHLGFGNT